MQTVTIENWAFAQIPKTFDRKGVASKRSYLALLGNIYGHRRYADGAFVPGTTPIVGYDRTSGAFVSTNGTKYRLGQVDPSFKASVYSDPVSALMTLLVKQKNNVSME
jgi:hypothetical protein